MDGSDIRFLRELRGKVEAAITEKEAAIAQGGLQDFATYRNQCGIIRGMRDALAIADDIEKRMNGDGER